MLTLQDARKLAKAGYREYFAHVLGNPAWWETTAADAVRKQVADRARQVILRQNAQTPPRVEVTQPPVAPVVPTVPEVAPVVTQTPDEAKLAAMRVQAAQLFPTPSSMPEKERKAQYDKRRRWLVANGAPRVAPKEGHTAFGRKLVNGVWVKL